jgi:hypothetical protein
MAIAGSNWEVVPKSAQVTNAKVAFPKFHP